MPDTHPTPLQVLRLSNRGVTHSALTHIAQEAETLGYDVLLVTDDGLDGVDPIAALSALAPATSTLGLVGEVDTSRQHPFGLARRLLGSDQVTRGRAGWAPTDTDPARLREAVRIVVELWDSWPDDAVVADKEANVWIDTDRVRPVVVAGEHYSVRAPLDFPRGPQGHPPLFTTAQDTDLSTHTATVLLDNAQVVDLDSPDSPVPTPASATTRTGGSLRERLGLTRVEVSA